MDTAEQITDENAHKVKGTVMSVQGIGFATANYFLMLLGRSGVKPDRMVHKFLKDATLATCSRPVRLSRPREPGRGTGR